MARLHHQAEQHDESFLKRTEKLYWLISLGFILVILRLWNLQIMAGEEYQLLSRHNRIEPVPIIAPRGRMLDRNGELIATNHPCFVLTAIPDQITETTLSRLAMCLGCKREILQARLDKGIKTRDIVLYENVPWPMVVQLEETSELFPGVQISATHRRHYIHEEATAHLLGYVGQVSEDDLARLPKGIYRMNDLVGKDGLERTYEARLRGADGMLFYETDSRRRRIRQASQPQGLLPVPGEDLVLSIDIRLQNVAHEALGEEAGAIVGVSPHSGEILCLVSHPTYDPNKLVPPVDSAYIRDVFNDKRYPLLNRAINSAYSPGSTFKPVVAIAGLAENKINMHTEITCKGFVQLGQRKFHCWRKRSHGSIPLSQALRYSCNCYFYQLGLRLGAREIDKYSQMLGLGQKTGIKLPSEKSGTLPSHLWARQGSGSWYQGDTVNLSIGQGYLTVTPIQMAFLYAAIVKDGIRYEPSLVKYAIPSGSDLYQTFEPKIANKLDLPSSNMAALRLGLWEVVNHPRGTGRQCRLPFPEVAGKTGTVQVISGLEDEEKPKELMDHAWFIGMAPAEEPEIVLVVFLEHGGKGGENAAPVAKRILESYFNNTINPLEKENSL